MSSENQSNGGGCPFNHQSQEAPVTTAEKCPMNHAAGEGNTNQDWWPNQLKVDILHQHDAPSNPMGDDFDYGYEKIIHNADTGEIYEPSSVSSKLRRR